MTPSLRVAIKMLLVEDDPGDVALAREFLKDANIPIHMDVVEDGVAALAYLRGEGPYRDASQPDLVLLDLNLPRKDGRAVLREMKGDDALKSIPVVVLTTSKSEEDVRAAYRLGSNCYITKPPGLKEYEFVMQRLGEFWSTIARIPDYEYPYP